MEKKYSFSKSFKIVCIALMAIGVISIAIGFISSPEKAWADLLLNNYYFLSLAIGASFFMALQYITQSGWSAAFKRISESFIPYIPVAAIIMFVLLFGTKSLYHWTHHEIIATDPILAHKEPYLNLPFFIIRMIFYFAVWIVLTQLLLKYSKKEDLEGGMTYFKKSEFVSKVYIFSLALTFSLASFDWIMSLEPHWYSTIFSLKNFIAAFFHGAAIITLIIIILHSYGYFPFITNAHWADLSKYIFILSIVWGYFWFAEYLLIWYANIPEETIYFVKRLAFPWKILFYGNIAINWLVPVVVLLSNYFARRKSILAFVIVFLIIGQWIDLYLQIMPGAVGKFKIGITDIGTFLGFTGLFIYLIASSLSKRDLTPKNHPYLEESLHHSMH